MKLHALIIRNCPDDLHKRLKVAAAHKGIPMYRLIIDILYEALRKEEER